MNDADLMTLELQDSANRAAHARSQGRCSHGSLMRLTCCDCGLTMANDTAWVFAMRCAEERECHACGADATTRQGTCGDCAGVTVATAPRYFDAY